MNNALLKLFVKLQSLMVHDEGQDLVEYALVIALIAIVAVGSLNTLASGIGKALTNIATNL